MIKLVCRLLDVEIYKRELLLVQREIARTKRITSYLEQRLDAIRIQSEAKAVRGKDKLFEKISLKDKAATNLFITILEEPIREEDMETIACAVSSYYNPLGRALGYDHEKVQDILSADQYEGQRNSEKLLAVIRAWKYKHGVKATLGRLLQACEKIEVKGRVELALIEKKTSK
ncbi:uncharacterized protein LOC134177736 [Corticium candelabrum]|nr:uncharacterized protein LOC134177736 [Corticium candelabrum]